MEGENKVSKEKKYIIIEKIQNFLNKFFYKIFDDSHLLYTIIFFLSALLIALLSLIPATGVGNFVIFFATAISLSFIILTLIGLIPQVHDFLFSKKILERRKLLIFAGILFLSFIILLFYFLFGSSTQLPIEFLGWDILLPPIFIVIYFGWNLLQIVFLRPSIESAAMKVNNKLIPEQGHSKRRLTFSYIFLGIGIIAPILMILGTLIGFYDYFDDSNFILFWFIGSHLIMFIVIVITSWRLIDLFLKSKKNDSTNVFSSVFYIIIWIYLWYRFFSFINSFRSQTQAGIDIFTALIDILLMVFTAITVLRSLGSKVYGLRIFNENNMPFFLYAFTMLYIEGQIIMITGAGSLAGVFSNRDQINLINNVLILLITVVFYLWYSGYVLQRKGLILRTHFTPKEVIAILKDYRINLKKRGLLDKKKPDEHEFQKFLDDQKITITGIEDIKVEEKVKEGTKEAELTSDIDKIDDKEGEQTQSTPDSSIDDEEKKSPYRK